MPNEVDKVELEVTPDNIIDDQTIQIVDASLVEKLRSSFENNGGEEKGINIRIRISITIQK